MLPRDPLKWTVRMPERAKLRGLGDVVAIVAQPVAMAIDAVAGTDLANCGGCQARQEALNKAFPMVETGVK